MAGAPGGGATLLLEIGFPLVLLRPRLGWLVVPGAVLLHASIWATLHLDYSAWAVTAIVVFVPWPAVVDAIRARATLSPASRRLPSRGRSG